MRGLGAAGECGWQSGGRWGWVEGPRMPAGNPKRGVGRWVGLQLESLGDKSWFWMPGSRSTGGGSGEPEAPGEGEGTAQDDHYMQESPGQPGRVGRAAPNPSGELGRQTDPGLPRLRGLRAPIRHWQHPHRAEGRTQTGPQLSGEDKRGRAVPRQCTSHPQVPGSRCGADSGRTVNRCP